MPYGFLVGVALMAAATSAALVPVRRPRAMAVASWLLALLVNEVPLTLFLVLLASTVLTAVDADLGAPGEVAVLSLAVLTCVGMLVLVGRAARTGPVVAAALDDALGTSWRQGTGRPWARRRLPWLRIVLAPWLMWRADVAHHSDVPYGDAGKRHRLDLYRPRTGSAGGPVLVYFHGGRFRHGAKDREARPLLYHLAGRGWLCVSANYRLRPDVAFPDHLVDAKRAVAWARSHAAEHGADPDSVFVAGSSAGAHLAAMVALTYDDDALQPGFEAADTSVAGAVCLSGYYGTLDTDPRHPAAAVPSTPIAHVRPDAPPVFVAHGADDTYVPVEGARRFATVLRNVSESPVVFAELPGAQHSFDVAHSLRFERVVDGVEAFTTWVRPTRATGREAVGSVSEASRR